MAGKSYSRELRERAVGLVFEQVSEYGSQWEAIRSVAAKVNVSAEALRRWVRQAEVDAGTRPGPSSEESAELKRLRREVAELRRANEILKAASAFFASGSSTLDRHARSVHHGIQGPVRSRVDLCRADRVRFEDRSVHLLCRPVAPEIEA
jgi:transposase